jgi:hypothetical protein
MKRWRHIAWIFLALSCCVRMVAAAENCSIEGKSFDDKPYHVALSPSWTDEEILRALGLKIREAKMTISTGVDGDARDYVVGRTRITISRTAMADIIVMLVLKDEDAYVWHLLGCRL